MNEVIYTKFSSERDPRFAIRTDIVRGEDGRRFLKKTALFPEGDAHIERMERAAAELGELFKDTPIRPCPAFAESSAEGAGERRSLCFTYLEGRETFVRRINRLRSEGKAGEADSQIRAAASCVFERATVPFTVTDEFTGVFGQPALPEGLLCLPVTDIDIVADNLLVSDGSDTIDLIDYEWTFFFPIPVRFVLYRTLHYYWHRELVANPDEADAAVAAQMAAAGADAAELACYAEMERHLQAWIAGGVTAVRDLLGEISPGTVSLEEMGFSAAIHGERTLRGSLYWSVDGQIREESRIPAQTVVSNGCFRTELPVERAQGAKLLRWDPLEGSCCRLRLERVETDDSVRIRPLNGYEKDGWMVFRTYDPGLLIEGEVGALKKLVFSGRLEMLPVGGELEDLNRMALRSIELEKTLSATEETLRAQQSTKGYRAIEKLRSVRNYMAARTRALPLIPSGPAPEAPYSVWFEQHRTKEEVLALQRITKLEEEPKISILVPTFRTPLGFLREMISSVQAQTYGNWELCIADASVREDGSGQGGELRSVLADYEKADPRIRVVFLDNNRGISENTNEAAKLATGDYITLLDHDDVLAPDALFETAAAIGRTGADVLYSDEDKVSMDLTTHFDPNLKPDYSPDLLCSHNYITHLFVVRTSLFREVGGFDPRYDGAQDYDLIFRCVEKANRVCHIPKILYHWRMHQESTAANPESKLYAYEAGRSAIEAHLARCGQAGHVERMNLWGLNHVIYDTPGDPLVSVIIPNMDHRKDLALCVDSLLEKSTWQNMEILIVENNSREKETFRYYEELKERDPRIRILRWKKEFNYAAINNFAVSKANGDYLLFLNNDTELMEPDSVREMLGTCMQPHIGCVGAKLFFADDTVQHAGIVLGFGGFAGHVFSGLRAGDLGFMMRAQITCDYSAVTAACLMVRRDVFRQAGGFDESFAVALNDVDFCLKVRSAGYYNVFVPFAKWHHYESKSRGYEDTPEKKERFEREIALFRSRWGELVDAGDPFYNPNFSVDKAPYTLRED